MLEDPGNMDSSSVSSLPHFSRCDSKSHSDFAISYKKEKWVSSDSQNRKARDRDSSSKPACKLPETNPTRTRNVPLQGALLAEMVANRMWASGSVCREEVIQNSKFRHRPGLLPSNERVGGRGGGEELSAHTPQPCLPGFSPVSF